jgi:hypothetical protein
MQRLLWTVAIFFSLPIKGEERRGQVSDLGFCVPAEDKALEGTRTEHKNTFYFSQTLDQSAVALSPHPSFTWLLPSLHKLSKHESAPAYKQCETFIHNHTKWGYGEGGIDLNSVSVYRVYRLTSQPTWQT